MTPTDFPSALRRALREPLLHFALLGALLFGIDHQVASRRDDPHRIVLGPEVDADAARLFRESRGREPNPSEMQTLRERWVDNEVLYREGLALRVDQGDPTIRERVIFKALNVVQANLELPAIDEAGLHAWFDAHRARYGDPARLDFLEAVLAGDANDEAVKGFVEALNRGASGATAGDSPAQPQGGLRVYKGRPRTSIVESFGVDFAAALEAMPAGTWAALPSKEGLRVVRLEAVHTADPVVYEQVRGEVLQDWKDAELAALRLQAVRDVGKKYRVETVGGTGGAR